MRCAREKTDKNTKHLRHNREPKKEGVDGVRQHGSLAVDGQMGRRDEGRREGKKRDILTPRPKRRKFS